MPELSIIVPVYKVEMYLPKCINSILAQTFQDFELILVDDGSPDCCGTICDEYATHDSRIVVIHQANAGVSVARNAGLDIAKGTYIGFVDSDDWIEPEMYEAMLRTAKDENLDVVICGTKCAEVSGCIFEERLETSGYYSGRGLLKELFGTPNKLGGGVCNKIFNAEKIFGIRFQNGVAIAEDLLFLFEAFLSCKNGKKIADTFYIVVNRPGSATRTGEINFFTECLISSKLLLLLLCRKYATDIEDLAINKFLDDCLRYVPEMKKTGQKKHQSYRITMLKIKWLMLREMFRAWRKKLLPKEKLHGYIYEWFRL